MGSDDDLRTVFGLRIISITVVIALIVGAGAGYMVGNSPIPGYKEEIERIETENLVIWEQLREEYTALQDNFEDVKESLTESEQSYDDLLQEQEQLQEECIDLQDALARLTLNYTSLQAEHDQMVENNAIKISELESAYKALKENYDELESAYETLNYSYYALQETYELYNVNLYKEIPFNITRQGVGYLDRYFDFDIGYGIICTTYIKVSTETSGVQIGAGSYWTRGGEGGFMGSSGRTYTQLEITLTGYAYCRIFDSGGQIRVEIGVRPRNQTSWHGRECLGTFPKELS